MSTHQGLRYPQRSALQAGLSEDSSLRPAVLSLLCTVCARACNCGWFCAESLKSSVYFHLGDSQLRLFHMWLAALYWPALPTGLPTSYTRRALTYGHVEELVIRFELGHCIGRSWLITD